MTQHMRVSILTCIAAVLPSLYCTAADVDPAVLQAEAARVAVMDKAKDSVLAVFSADGNGGGSGVVITPDGYALTNFHVVQPCGSAMKCGMADGKAYDAVVVGIDPTGDIALIKLVGREDFPCAVMGDSNELASGEACFAMGNPFLLASDYQPTVTYGIISGVHRYQPPAGTILEYTDCLQTDASINPGNSGGPLFDARGRLIGINGRCSFEKRGRVNVGVAYAISINQIKNFLGCLRSGRIVDHATLGATVAGDGEGRVIINDILEECDAYRRGLREGDELVSFGGRPITTPNAFKNVLGIYPMSWRVPLSYRRDGKRQDILVRLRALHGKEELIEKTEGRPKEPPMPIPLPEKKKKAGKPSDGDKPKPDGDGPADDGQPKIGPMHPMMPGKPPIPDVVKPLIEEKRGFANYHFNKLERDRVWKAWTAKCNLAAAAGAWSLDGNLDGGGEFHFDLGAGDVVLKLKTLESKWNNAEGLTASLNPPNSGGLLPALHLWRRMNIEGPDKFGDVIYLGACPLSGHPEPVDVLVGTCQGMECWFYFDPKDGLMLAMEMFPEEGVDPCELYFSEYREADGRNVPGRLEVRHGNDLFAVFKFAKTAFAKTAQPEEKCP